jgi:hypothetical protein
MDKPTKSHLYALRVTPDEQASYQDAARRTGHRSVAAWVRYVLRAAVEKMGGYRNDGDDGAVAPAAVGVAVTVAKRHGRQ